MSTRDDVDHLHWRTQGEVNALQRELDKERAWLPEGDDSSDATDAIYERIDATGAAGLWSALKLLADRVDELRRPLGEIEIVGE